MEWSPPTPAERKRSDGRRDEATSDALPGWLEILSGWSRGAFMAGWRAVQWPVPVAVGCVLVASECAAAAPAAAGCNARSFGFC